MKRKIRLLTVKETTPDAGEISFSYAETMISALRAGGFQGITIGEMKDRLDTLDIIEAAQKEGTEAVLLTPKQHGALKAAVSQLRFSRLLRSAVEMMDHVEHAPEVDEE